MLRMQGFFNREIELSLIQENQGKACFGYVTGRRRVGKTAILLKACEKYGGFYHQAVEGAPQQQIEYLTNELKASLPIFHDVRPKSWNEFFTLLSRENLPPLLVFDEFPYWVASDPSLPSILQKWIDHSLVKQKTLLLVSGSSQTMLYSQFLRHESPLYGRASFHMHLQPLSYQWFCRALGYKMGQALSFSRFSLMGGVPHYWRLLKKSKILSQVEDLYFRPGAPLAEEPQRLLRDENVSGNVPKSLLDLAGRGVAKPGEMASRLEMPQGNLSRPLAQLLELGLLHREMPLGESTRTSKKVLYSIRDPALAFYYGVYLSHRARWPGLSRKEKTLLVEQHVSRRWEDYCRLVHSGSSRYWEGDIEIDCIAPLSGGKYLIAECKWKKLTQKNEDHLLQSLKEKFYRTKLTHKLKNVEFAILSKKDLARLARKEMLFHARQT